MISIVIPAHNEESVIGRCLESLLCDGATKGAEIIVVCNGCSDRTSEIAKGFSGVRVVDLDQASKIAALNAGDQAAGYFPRVYLDADITVNLNSLLSACEVLSGEVKLSAPQSVIDLSRSGLLVKLYFSTWMKLPYYQSGQMIGSGIYILSESGRSTFQDWPEVIADDAYVRALFEKSEMRVDEKSEFTIYPPTKLSGLIKIRTRARFGNIQLERVFPKLKVVGENTSKHLLAVGLKKPIGMLVYIAVQVIVLLKCRSKLKKKDFDSWERDDSARST